MPSESPTRMSSTPASATSRAVGKSYAVSIARCAPLLRFSSRTVGVFMSARARAAAFVEDHRLPELRRQALGDHTGDVVQGAARPISLSERNQRESVWHSSEFNDLGERQRAREVLTDCTAARGLHCS